MLVLASPTEYGTLLAPVFAGQATPAEIVYAAADGDAETVAAQYWTVVLVPLARAEDWCRRLADQMTDTATVLIYTVGDEARAFSFSNRGFAHILPVDGLRHLPVLLQREMALAQAQQEVQRNVVMEAHYRSIVEDQNDPVCHFTPDFRVTFANQAYSELFGMTPKQIIGTNPLDRIPKHDRNRAINYIRSLTWPTRRQHRSIARSCQTGRSAGNSGATAPSSMSKATSCTSRVWGETLRKAKWHRIAFSFCTR
ncbi:MAG: PAS domain-containing protein [Caldilineaceae bacterium]